ncbi:MAG: hypothetical protein GF399_05695 [Candidatus Coatesbacteria bacterium]|nr:hypothetical protein [Candidatus Coatesbacteria bacterium]
MKKLLLVMIVLIVPTLVGCGDGTAEEAAASAENPEDNTEEIAGTEEKAVPDYDGPDFYTLEVGNEWPYYHISFGSESHSFTDEVYNEKEGVYYIRRTWSHGSESITKLEKEGPYVYEIDRDQRELILDMSAEFGDFWGDYELLDDNYTWTYRGDEIEGCFVVANGYNEEVVYAPGVGPVRITTLVDPDNLKRKQQ